MAVGRDSTTIIAGNNGKGFRMTWRNRIRLPIGGHISIKSIFSDLERDEKWKIRARGGVFVEYAPDSK